MVDVPLLYIPHIIVLMFEIDVLLCGVLDIYSIQTVKILASAMGL